MSQVLGAVATPAMRRSAWSTWPTPTAGPTTSPWSSSTSRSARTQTAPCRGHAHRPAEPASRTATVPAVDGRGRRRRAPASPVAKATKRGSNRVRASRSGSREPRRPRLDRAAHRRAAGVGRPPDDTLAPGSQLAFGDRGEQTLAEDGPRSDEFFLGDPTAAVPVARSTARVPPQPQPRLAARRRTTRRAGASAVAGLGIPRRVTFRVLGFVILVAAVPVGAYTPSGGTPTTTGS